MTVPNHQIEQLKARVPLSSVVGKIIDLRPASGGELKGLCPFHEEKTPSFHVNDQKGTYHCFGCEAGGDVIRFLTEHQGISFTEAVAYLEGQSGFELNATPLLSKPSKEAKPSRNAEWAKEIWDGAGPVEGTIGEDYLKRRGIDLARIPDKEAIRFSWLPCPGMPGEHPTLIAAFTDLSGAVTSVQRIFLTRDGRKISAEHPEVEGTPCLGSSLGSAVKFGEATECVTLVEGVEDALTLALVLPGAAVWACTGTSKVPKVELPAGCHTVRLALDNDDSGRGAVEKASLVFERQGRAVQIHFPPAAYKDWSDMLVDDSMGGVEAIANVFAETPTSVSFSWPEPMPIEAKLLPVPAFNLDLLPDRLKPWVGDISDRLCVPPDFAAVAAMVTAGGMIGSKIAIRPQKETSWSEVCNLWGVICAAPGAMKSPALNEVLSPLRRLEGLAEQQHQRDMRFFDDEFAVHKMAKEGAERRARKAVQSGNLGEAQAILGEVEDIRPPTQTRHIVFDATVERLGEICADNPAGVIAVRDELMSLMRELDQPDKVAARGFYMSGWAGNTFYQFDRIGRGATRVDPVCISLLGTTQPDLLANYMRGSLAANNDGMIQRIQLLTWPDMPAGWVEVDRIPDVVAKEDAFACYEQLARLDPAHVGAECDPSGGKEPPFLRFDPAALEMSRAYRKYLEELLEDEELAPPMLAHFGKYRGLIPRLALICHLASGGTGPVSVRAMQQALGWAGYLEQHARRAYGSLAVDNHGAARDILGKIAKGQLSDGFTEKDIYKNSWSGLGKGNRLSGGLTTLCDGDWLSPTTVATGGKPKVIYNINPNAMARLVI